MPRYILKKVVSNVGKMDNGVEYDYCRIEVEMPIRESDNAFGFGTKTFDLGSHQYIHRFKEARAHLKSNGTLDYQPVIVEFEYTEEMAANEKRIDCFVIPETLKIHLPQPRAVAKPA